MKCQKPYNRNTLLSTIKMDVHQLLGQSLNRSPVQSRHYHLVGYFCKHKMNNLYFRKRLSRPWYNSTWNAPCFGISPRTDASWCWGGFSDFKCDKFFFQLFWKPLKAIYEYSLGEYQRRIQIWVQAFEGRSVVRSGRTVWLQLDHALSLPRVQQRYIFDNIISMICQNLIKKVFIKSLTKNLTFRCCWEKIHYDTGGQ